MTEGKEHSCGNVLDHLERKEHTCALRFKKRVLGHGLRHVLKHGPKHRHGHMLWQVVARHVLKHVFTKHVLGHVLGLKNNYKLI